METLITNKERINQVYECVKTFHTLEVFPPELPNPQHINLLPLLRPYQVNAVKWMLTKELYPSYYPSLEDDASETNILLPKGGILAEEMGLGKTVEVLACILCNPKDMTFKSEQKSVEVVSITNSGHEVQPTEDGTVEIQSIDANKDANLSSGLGESFINDSGSDKVENQNESWTQSESSVDLERKTKKRVRCDNIENPPTKKRKVGAPLTRPKRAAPGETYARLKAWYEDKLSEASVQTTRSRGFQQQSSFQCCCLADTVSDNVVECPLCKTWQHAECVGYDEEVADYQYYCFRCWIHQPPVVSAGTVIISPEAISQQWVSEIEKHIKKDNLKVLVYEGVRVSGYIQPHDLASYDVVITTYQVLSKELNYTKPVQRNLRHAKRFFAPTSPLLFVHWWRLCLDEAQMVEGSVCRAADMAKKFLAVNKWAITGTPIQKAVNDLIGLMEFLAGKEYPEFLELMGRNWRSLLKLVPRVLWRTQMKDVLAETGVPPQTVETHLLDFSKIEAYFYQCTHTECSSQFIQRINKFGNLNIPLKSLDRKAISNLLNLLLKIRQACLHPQAVRGKFLSMKKTMTMEDLVAQMVTNAKLDTEQALRQLVATLNGMGALHIIRHEYADAVTAYRTVLHLEQDHSGRLKIDSLQKIHAMHNLAEVLDGNYEGIPPTLRDSMLREDIKALELRYLGKREAPISVTEERVIQHSDAISTQLNGKPLGYSEWWMRLLEWSTERDELLDRLKAAIQHTDVKQKNQFNNLANKLNSLFVVRGETAVWLAELDQAREEAREWLNTLMLLDRDTMAAKALVCHLPQAASLRGKTRCELCRAECALKNYEALLFEEKSKEKRKNKKRNLPGSSDWGDDNDLDNKEIAELVDVNVNTFESSKKGGFKASPFEKILRALAAYGRFKQAPSAWTKDAAQHFILLDRLKKEFLDLNLLWRQIFDLVDAKDELNMCKTRLRLPYEGEDEENEKKVKKKIGENQHIIALYKVEPELFKLDSEKTQYEAMLKKKYGTLCYLEHLQKDGGPAAICPICRNDLSEKWSVLKCGHCVCLDCLSVVMRQQSTLCPQCRQHFDLADVSYVESEPGATQPQPQVKGSHSTKVTAVIEQTLQLVTQQPDVKILVFSTWDKVLHLLGEAFAENNISFRHMQSGKLKKRQFIKEFKTGDVTVLLLPLRSGAKGINLVEATHVFLVEPILNPAEELQAVGRVHRIGQTRPTVVHRFIVRETIEERIMAALATSGAEQWSDDCVTLQQLFDLFSSDVDLSLSQSQAGPSNVNVDSSDNDSDQEDAGLSHVDSDTDEG